MRAFLTYLAGFEALTLGTFCIVWLILWLDRESSLPAPTLMWFGGVSIEPERMYANAAAVLAALKAGA